MVINMGLKRVEGPKLEALDVDENEVDIGGCLEVCAD